MSGDGELSVEQSWHRAVERGRVRGYEETKPCADCSGGEEWRQYAIRKKDGRYQTYFFAVDAGRMEIMEDCAQEERSEFANREDALAHLRLKGADPSRFAPFKGQKPF
ncbi:hypothetical protein CDO73_16040 [Saccharibacillus sp. O23]|uniref:hypothetical protein n=1 Tax=Saccharibacillus sp. O23 TaxID=2009338 RepID=UPI000B4E258C|nr:hypothetical protein [Saccharibacillus sp. O23]OWR29172.1 hypothetical protein CDO73_16040 [Saccharibacillus sp. O23]